MSLWRYHSDADETPASLWDDQKCQFIINRNNGVYYFVAVLLSAVCNTTDDILQTHLPFLDAY